jgi:transcriptional repressor of cell division inhibition gene dicB
MSSEIFNLIGKIMTTQEAIEHYGGIKQLSDALGTWPQTIYQWGESPPMARQYELEVKTKGKLKADRD